MSNDVLKDYIDELSRWGRWGPDDELGALNLLTPQHVQAAAKEVMAGRVISMTLPYDQAGPQQGGLRHNPMLLATATGTDVVSGKQQELFSAFGIDKTRFGYADDSLIMPTQCGTQWDALAHIFHDGRMWNGYSAAEHTTARRRPQRHPALDRPHDPARRFDRCRPAQGSSRAGTRLRDHPGRPRRDAGSPGQRRRPR